MKPLNLNKESCNPISSNCVVWQGPEIECINLCKGDTVTDVVYKLAVELCELLETFDVDSYDISCFNLLECNPKDFQALIQLLIDKVCSCCGVTPEPAPGGTVGCPDCEVEVCSAFYYQSPQGDVITTMQLDEYVTAIGNRVCQIILQIDTINATLENHEERIDALENAPIPTLVLPNVTPECVLPSVPTSMDEVLTALEVQFCELRVATGNPSDIYQAILRQCQGLNNSNQLAGSGTMQNIAGWAATVSSMADAMNNVWLTICDLRSSIQTIQANCCDTGCDGIGFTITAVLNTSDQLQINFSGTVPANFVDCQGGSVITITDALGGTNNISLNIIQNYLNNPLGYIQDISTGPVNGNYDITVLATLCSTDLEVGSTCQTVASAIATASADCPNLIIVTNIGIVNYSGNYIGLVPETVVIELWNTSQTVLLESQVYNLTQGNTSLAGQFTGLNDNTTYYIRPVVGGSECPFQDFITPEQVCLPPAFISFIELPFVPPVP